MLGKVDIAIALMSRTNKGRLHEIDSLRWPIICWCVEIAD